MFGGAYIKLIKLEMYFKCYANFCEYTHIYIYIYNIYLISHIYCLIKDLQLREITI